VVLPAWTESHGALPRQESRRIDNPDELIGDAPASVRRAPSKRRSSPQAANTGSFSQGANSRFYGGCGALNGQPCRRP
jgi:hypothetical protein